MNFLIYWKKLWTSKSLSISSMYFKIDDDDGGNDDNDYNTGLK